MIFSRRLEATVESKNSELTSIGNKLLLAEGKKRFAHQVGGFVRYNAMCVYDITLCVSTI